MPGLAACASVWASRGLGGVSCEPFAAFCLSPLILVQACWQAQEPAETICLLSCVDGAEEVANQKPSVVTAPRVTPQA